MSDLPSTFFGAYGVHYQLGSEPILKDVSFELEHGEILALIGPNGSGKSTLLKAASGILPGSTGVMRLRGSNFLALSSEQRARSVAYVGQDLLPEFPMTAYEAVLLGRSCHPSYFSNSEDRVAVRKAMEDCLCWEFHRQDLHTLSGGERQLVALARALAQGAPILFLDETLSRMDLNHQAEMGALLKRLASQGSAIVLVAHDLNLASEWARTGLLLNQGQRLAYGPIGTVLTDERIAQLYPNSSLTVAPSPTTGAPKVFFGKPHSTPKNSTF